MAIVFTAAAVPPPPCRGTAHASSAGTPRQSCSLLCSVLQYIYIYIYIYMYMLLLLKLLVRKEEEE